MSGDTPPRPDTPAEKAEKAKIRRRWLTLGEVLAVVAVAISGLTLYNSWSERQDDRTAKAAADRNAAVAALKADAASTILVLRAEPSQDGARLTLRPRSDDQAIQGQTLRLPAALAVVPVETTGDARIEAGWFDTALKQARRAAGRRDESTGDERLPIAIETRFLVGDALHTDVSLYDLGYVVEGGGLLGGTDVRLRGLSLIARASATQAQARLDDLWKSRQPTISSAPKK